jgi:glycosyltransferase involved in cell wall biosynthesis
MSIAPQSRTQSALVKTFPFAMWGILFFSVGVFIFVITSLVNLPIRLVLPVESTVFRDIVWLSGAPIVLGTLLITADFALFYRARRRGHELSRVEVDRSTVTVVLTAYNDEPSIADAVRDFTSNPLTKRVIVVDNNSVDGTAKAASEAGATVVTELKPGYGYCVHRALSEGAKYRDTALVVLCEGDMTFRATDIEKLLAYIPHGDVVNGTRIVEQLRERVTQLTTFMFWGNFVGGKLLEFKHLGRGTVTDLGTTYKLCRSSFLRDHLADYDPRVNLEFNAHFLDTTIKNGFKLVEAPVTFHARVGESKGGNVSNSRATRVGLRMLVGLLFSWKLIRTRDIP